MGGIEFNGVNGNTPVRAAGNNVKPGKVGEPAFDFGIETAPVGDAANFSTKPAFNQYDMDQMYAMAGITKPDGIKSLENTMAFASEGAEYGVNYSEDDMNLARFMFEYLK